MTHRLATPGVEALKVAILLWATSAKKNDGTHNKSNYVLSR
jgi:hypothetical protein